MSTTSSESKENVLTSSSNSLGAHVSAVGTGHLTPKPRGVGPRSGARANPLTSTAQGLSRNSGISTLRLSRSEVLRESNGRRPGRSEAATSPPSFATMTSKISSRTGTAARTSTAVADGPTATKRETQRRQPLRPAMRLDNIATDPSLGERPPSSFSSVVGSPKLQPTAGSGHVIDHTTSENTSAQSSQGSAGQHSVVRDQGTEGGERKKRGGSLRVPESTPAPEKKARRVSGRTRSKTADQKVRERKPRLRSDEPDAVSVGKPKKAGGANADRAVSFCSKNKTKQTKAVSAARQIAPHRQPPPSSAFDCDFELNDDEDENVEFEECVSTTAADIVEEATNDSSPARRAQFSSSALPDYFARRDSRCNQWSAMEMSKQRSGSLRSSFKRAAPVSSGGRRGQVNKAHNGRKNGDTHKARSVSSRHKDGDKPMNAEARSRQRKGDKISEQTRGFTVLEEPSILARSRLPSSPPLFGFGEELSEDDEEMLEAGVRRPERRETGSWLMSDADETSEDSDLGESSPRTIGKPAARGRIRGGGKSRGDESGVRRHIKGGRLIRSKSGVEGSSTKEKVARRRSAPKGSAARPRASVDARRTGNTGRKTATTGAKSSRPTLDDVVMPSKSGRVSGKTATAQVALGARRRKSAAAAVGRDAGEEEQLAALRALYSKVDAHNLTLER